MTRSSITLTVKPLGMELRDSAKLSSLSQPGRASRPQGERAALKRPPLWGPLSRFDDAVEKLLLRGLSENRGLRRKGDRPCAAPGDKTEDICSPPESLALSLGLVCLEESPLSRGDSREVRKEGTRRGPEDQLPNLSASLADGQDPENLLEKADER